MKKSKSLFAQFLCGSLLGGVRIAAILLLMASIRGHAANSSSIAFLNGTQSVSESAGKVTLTLVRQGSTADAVFASVRLSSPNAAEGTDYQGPKTFLMQIPEGSDSATKDIQLIDDSIPEPDETLTASLIIVAGADVSQPTSTIITIVDDDATPILSSVAFMQPGPELVLESAGGATISLIRSGDLSQSCSVQVVPGPGVIDPATPGLDFATSFVTANFDSGQSIATVVVPITDDSEFEADESIDLSMQNPVNCTLGQLVASLILIQNDEPKPRALVYLTKSVAPEIIEIGNKVQFTVTAENLDGAAATDVEITDVLPVGLVLDPKDVPAGAKLTGNNLVWSLKTLNKGAVFKETLTFPVGATKPGSYLNSVSVTKLGVDGPTGNDTKKEARVVFVGHALCGRALLCNLLGLPNSNATVRLQDAAGKLVGEQNAGLLGSFCFNDLVPGKYKLLVTPADPKSGIRPTSEDITVPSNIVPYSTFATYKLLTGRVVLSPGGRPQEGITVTADDGKKPVTTKTDKDGRYFFFNLPDAEYTVKVEPPLKDLTTRPVNPKVTLPGTECPTVVNFDFYGTLTIKGRLAGCGANGPSIPYGFIKLENKTLGEIQTIRAASDGTFTFKNLPPGEFQLTPTHPTFTFNPAITTVTLAKADKYVTLVGTDQNRLGGRLLGPGFNPIAGREIRLFGPLPLNGIRPAAASKTVTTDADGSFIFEGLANGRYDLEPATTGKAEKLQPGFYRHIVGPNNACLVYGVFISTLSDAELVALEVVQVSQDWQNSLPLVEHKAALVRAFVRPAGGPNAAPVQVDGAQLKISRDGKLVTTLTATAISARADYVKRRNAKETSLAFSLPRGQATGSITATLEWPKGSLTTAVLPGQTAVKDNATTVKFQPTAKLPVKWILINWEFNKKAHKAPAREIDSHTQRLLAMLPSPEVTPNGKPDTLEWEPPTDPADPLMTKEERFALWGSLQKLLLAKRNREAPGIDAPRFKPIYYGVLVDTMVGGHAGGIPGSTLFADLGKTPAGLSIPAHEFGHALGRHHAVHSGFGLQRTANDTNKVGACDEPANLSAPDFPMTPVTLLDPAQTHILAPVLGPMSEGDYKYIYGWDRGTIRYISPFSTADMMSYCFWGTGYGWPGNYTYVNLFNAIINRFGAGRAPAPTSLSSLVEGIQISGEIDLAAGLVNLDPLFPVAGIEASSGPESGPCLLRLLDREGNVLAEESFLPESPVNEGTASDLPMTAYFSFVVPRPAAFAALEIHYDGRRLLRRDATAHEPQIQLLEPVAHSVLSGETWPIRWTATDLDGDPLRFLIECSTDGGVTWNVMAHALTGSELIVSRAQFPGTTQGRIRVTAGDGFQSAVAEAGPFTTPDQPPQVAIEQPANGVEFDGDATVHLSAHAFDLEDGLMGDVSYSWASDLNGVLGNGAELDVNASALQEGTHTVSVTVTDSAGQTAREQRTLRIQRAAVVALSIQRVGDQVILSWPLRASTHLLQSSFAPETAGWDFVEELPGEEGEFVRLILPVDAESSRFFRLIAP